MNTINQTEFYAQAAKLIDKFLEYSPLMATQMGDHRYDDRLSDYSRSGLDRQQKELKQALLDLEKIDTTSYEIDARIDHRLMLQSAKAVVRGFEKTREHSRNPGMYSQECMFGVFILLIKEYAPLEVRLEKVLGRLRAIPAVLAQGKQNIIPEEVPPVWNDIALESCQQGAGLFKMLIPALAPQVPHLSAALSEASREAARAFEEYTRFLQDAVAVKAAGNFAVGKELFEEMLHDDHMIDYTAETLLATGWELLAETSGAMEVLAKQIDPQKTVKDLLEEAKANHPAAADLLDVYRREMAAVRQFVIDHHIASIPAGEQLKIEPTPPFIQGTIPYAAYMMPGPLEELQQGIFLVTPVDPASPAAVQEEKLKGHNYSKLPVVALHEAYPGHHLQFIYANRSGSLPRKFGGYISTLFPEGWAFYCEELMEQLGYISRPEQRLARLNDQIWRAARIVLDVSLHTGKMSVEEAIDFLVEKGGLERTNARAEVRRYTTSPTQPMSYLIGKLEILKLIDAYKQRHPQATLQEIHEAVLVCGSLPPRLMRQRLFSD